MSGSPTRTHYQNGGPYTSPVPRGSYNNNSTNGVDYPTRNGGPNMNGTSRNVSPVRNGSPSKQWSKTSLNGSPTKKSSITRVAPTDSPKPEEKPGILQRFSNVIISSLESVFYKLGKSIGTHPIKYMIGCTIIAALCGIGIALAFKETTETNKLWAASDSEVIMNLDLVQEWYPSSTRFVVVMVKSPNILDPSIFGKMIDFYEKVENLQTDSGVGLTDVCIKVGASCSVSSILELWRYNGTVIRSLTQADILNEINTATISPMTGRAYDVSTALGEITKNSTGSIIGSTGTKMTWLLNGNDTIKPKSEEWESKFLALAEKETALTLNYFASRSFGDEAGGAISGDVAFLSAGYFILIIYVSIVLGRFNQVEQGIYLALSGILCVGFSISVSFGLASAFGLEYGPLHSILPFLLLGIGVDDMFVIMGALNNLNPDEIELEIPEKIGHVLKHAGLSVTVTSLTDIVAFGIGATTQLPALKSFCGFASLGILGLFVFQLVFFTATLTLDQKRRGDDRNACCCCYKHKDYTPNVCSQKEILITFFKKYFAPFLMKLPVKIVLFILTLAIFGVNVYGVISLKQEFDSNWFIPQDSYAFLYLTESEKIFPDDGREGSIYCGNIDYFGSRTELDLIYTGMTNNKYSSNGTFDSWFETYTTFLETTTNPMYTSSLDANKYPVNESAFVDTLFKYVFTEQPTLIRLMKFADANGGDLVASQMKFRLKNLPDSSTEIAAMDSLRKVVSDAGFSNTDCFAYARSFLNWETNKVIKNELYRNLGLAFACVFVVTLILIANLWTCLMVSSCVMFTLVNVGGSMHFWGLTIETVTSIQLILAIGLAVDYSAHIGHTFMTIKGTRNERAKETLSEMGPPVFNGGFSTFLAFILLAGSNSYVFLTFFKVFFLVVWYGLFHGLVYLPILLSWLGPSPYLTADHIYHNKVPPTGDHVAHHEHSSKHGMSMTSTSKQPYRNNGYVRDDDDIDTIYIPPPDYTPPTIRKKGLPRVGS